MNRVIILASIVAAGAAMAGCAPQARPEVATVKLGSSGAVLTITTLDDPFRPGTAARRMTLTSTTRQSQTLRLRDAGGRAGNTFLGLFHIEGRRYRLVSEQDCVDMDAGAATLTHCRQRAEGDGCSTDSGTFIGGFNWAGGTDPDGGWRHRFRYLPPSTFWCVVRPRPA